FQQTLKASPESPAQTCQGHAFFKAPGRFRIERAAEREQIFICNGKKLWIFTPSYQQVLTGSWKGWAKTQQMLPGWIDLENYVDRLEKGFALSLEDGGPDASVLVARPKGEAPGETLRLWIRPGEFLPARTELKSGETVIE